jgi:hypothetical protein
MEKKDLVTRILAVLGTLLAWFPILLPIVFSLAAFSRVQILRFDFLIPAEIFPVVLVGAGLLVWAARRAHRRRGLIGWSIGLILFGLLAAISLAQVTGLASGEIEPVGWPVVLVNICFAVFWTGLIGMAVGGILLWRDLARQQRALTLP